MATCDLSRWPSTDGYDRQNTIADKRSVEVLYIFIGTLVNSYLLQEPIMQPPFKISGTFIGVIHTRSLEFIDSNGPGGFGDQGFFPAETQLIAVKDLSISNFQKR